MNGFWDIASAMVSYISLCSMRSWANPHLPCGSSIVEQQPGWPPGVCGGGYAPTIAARWQTRQGCRLTTLLLWVVRAIQLFGLLMHLVGEFKRNGLVSPSSCLVDRWCAMSGKASGLVGEVLKRTCLMKLLVMEAV
ncbi:hypothetical protein CBR_g12001 [Chara braunii]|uniref:Uncharacterized protein n=1 Tax=Chara braunii TaxID=69332 RepID=A0A388KQW9_CHABU|nr:hypothetical protein CBR_g12001 [Chara braunii]|eukprot:GBG72422.1 hypothetical protein CBR_g12001 [Chara braunii]